MGACEQLLLADSGLTLISASDPEATFNLSDSGRSVVAMTRLRLRATRSFLP
ncbi:MAG: hypothetical protein JWN13_2862 [Betaproteobacteria bacterium]|nr:hypothetical protein [Betaproteobacteria bacterium]